MFYSIYFILKFSGIDYIYNVVQPLPLSISRTSPSSHIETFYALNNNSSFLPYPRLCKPSFCFLSLWIWILSYIGGMIYLFFCVWIISFGIMFSKFNYVWVPIRNSLFLKVKAAFEDQYLRPPWMLSLEGECVGVAPSSHLWGISFPQIHQHRENPGNQVHPKHGPSEEVTGSFNREHKRIWKR